MPALDLRGNNQGSPKEQWHAIPPDIQAKPAEEETRTLNHLIASFAAERRAHVGHPGAEGKEATHTSAQAAASAYLFPNGQIQAEGNHR